MAGNVGISAEADTMFFNTYDNYAVHEKMLRDEVRTRSCMKAIEDNPHLFQDKIVLDIGTGTDILSMSAIRAGAKHVVAVDASNMIEKAREIAKQNGMADRITFIRKKVEDASLPKVDIIIVEWMGYCLLSETMLDTLIDARNKHLVSGGLMFPNKVSLYVAAIEDSKGFENIIGYWDNVYDFDFSALKSSALNRGRLATPGPGSVLTSSAFVLDIDLQSVGVRENMQIARPVQGPTGPFTAPTHWKQTMFYLEYPVGMSKGGVITGRVSSEQHQRDLNVSFSHDLAPLTVDDRTTFIASNSYIVHSIE